MKLDQLTEIGRIQRAHGLKGEIKINFDPFYLQDIPSLTALVLKKGDDYLPFFIQALELTAQPSLVKFESISTKEDASKLNGKVVYALSNQLSAIKENQLDALVNLQLFNSNNQPIGTIEEVLEFPHQVILKLTINEQEVLIPFSEELVIELTPTTLVYQIPEGLLDLYQ